MEGRHKLNIVYMYLYCVKYRGAGSIFGIQNCTIVVDVFLIAIYTHF